jgi:serine/threonine-protein kinase/endoribonuclease IRE1
MSPERYPLVLFGGSERKSEEFVGQNNEGGGRTYRKTLDPPRRKGYRPDGSDEDEPVTPGGAKERSDVNDGDDLLDTCLLNPHHLRCLVGVRPIEDDGRYEGRMKRLLEGPKPAVQQHAEVTSNTSEGQGSVIIEAGRHMDDNSSGLFGGLNDDLGLPDTASTGPTARIWPTWFTLGSDNTGGGTFEIVVLSLMLGLVSLWFMWKRVKRRIGEVVERKEKEELWVDPQPIPNVESLPLPHLQNGQSTEDTKDSTSTLDGFDSPILSSGIVKELPPLPLNDPPPRLALHDTSTPENAVDTEDEAEMAGTPITPGKKRVRRGKRGKKKKTGAVANTPAADDEGDQESQESPTEKASVVLVTSPKTPVTSQPSLVVSDTILGRIFAFYFLNHRLIMSGSRFWITRNGCFSGIPPRSFCCRQTAASGFRHPRRPRSIRPARI